MVVMALLMGVLFIGTVGLTQYLAVTAGPNETILSALARRLFEPARSICWCRWRRCWCSSSPPPPVTPAIRASSPSWPRTIHARQLRAVGDRLVFSNGILLLTILTAG